MIRHINHTADDGYEIIADSLEELFYEAGYELLDMLYDRKTISEKDTKEINLESPSLDMLLHDFLAELLEIAQYELFPIKRIEILELSDQKLRAKVYGEPFDPKKHKFRLEIKAVTYHQLAVKKQGNKWFGRVIFDL